METVISKIFVINKKKSRITAVLNQCEDVTDEKLVHCFLSGDNLAFEKLINRHIKAVYNFLYQLTKDRSSLDDLTQETFIKAWKSITRFDKSKNFKAWVFAIAKNTAFDYLKKKKSIPFSSLAKEESEKVEINDEDILPDEIFERQAIAKELEERLKEIPDHYRVILLLRYKDDFSLQEISQILGESYNTIKSKHSRALASLKKILLSNF